MLGKKGDDRSEDGDEGDVGTGIAGFGRDMVDSFDVYVGFGLVVVVVVVSATVAEGLNCCCVLSLVIVTNGVCR